MDGSNGDRASRKRWHVAWRPQPGPQTDLLTCPVEDVLFGGARGGGKSDALLGDFAAQVETYGGAVRGIIVRRTMPQLEELIARSKQLYPALGANWMAGTKTWTWPTAATLKMRWLERDEDADNYQGHQYTWVGIDEAGTWPSPDAIDKLRATLRSPTGIPCVIRLTANPGGVGHQWLKERYVQGHNPREPFYDVERRTWRVFIPSRVTDNRALLDNDPGYLDRIRSSGPPWLVRAWLEGDWDASAGEAFFAEASILEDGLPVEPPTRCDTVFAVIDSAVKTGTKNDGTAVVLYAYNRLTNPCLHILDWDIVQVEGALLETWLPTVFQNLEMWAGRCGARYGSQGAMIEDRSSGMILLQQANRRGWPARPINSALTAVGKDERAISVSGYVWQGMVRITAPAYHKVTAYKTQSRNHFLSQVTGFRVGLKDQADDLLDCFCYGVALTCGNSKGF